MKKTIAALTLLAVTVAGARTAAAGDREWATVGKVLTGLVAAQVVAQALEPAPVYYAPPLPVYVQPAPVIVAPPPPVIVAPPVYVAPAPVYVPAPRVYYRPYYAPPVVSFHFGFGHHHGSFHHGHRHYRCW
jgi:hypothetical protein